MRTQILLVMIMLVPFAAADETHADCEPDQPWIGYARTDLARSLAEPALAEAGVELDACEGEQWDGQDAVHGETSSVGMGSDPNAEPSGDPFDPAGLRVSTRGTEAYLSFSVAFVARGALYAGTCGAQESGLEGDATCGGTRELRTGAYVRDNTPGNLIVQLTPQCLLSISGCYASEADCSHATYQHGQYHPPSQCGRDNTAIGARLLLP